MPRSKSLARAVAFVMVASGLSLVGTASLAATDGPTYGELNALVSAESNLATLAKHYTPSAAWAAHFRAAEAAQNAALFQVNAALAPAKSRAPVSKGSTASTTTEASVQVDTGTVNGFEIDIETDTVRPAPGTVRVTLVDTATHKLIASWMNGQYSSLVGDPTLYLDWNVSGGETDTLVLDASNGTPWSGPASVSVSDPDVLNQYVGVWAAFLGQPGFAPSKSSTVPI